MLKEFRKYPAIFTLLPFMFGILLAHYLNSRFFSANVTRILLFALVITAAFIYFKLLPHFPLSKLFCIYLLLIFVSGFIRLEQKLAAASNDNLPAIINELNDRDVQLFGSVIEQPEFNNDYIRLLVNSDSIVTSKGVITPDIKILCRIYRNKYSEQVSRPVSYGDAVNIKGKLQNLPHKKNPGEFDYGQYLKIHGINAVFTTYGFENVSVTGASNPDFYKKNILYPVKTYTVNVIDKLVPGNEGEFLKGLVIGERSGISKKAKEDFVNAGVAHIIAVSGLNVAYVLICASLLLTFIPVPYKYKIFILILILIFYMNLTGNVPSIVRAVIMATMFLLSKLLERKPNSYSILSFSALIILLVDPEQLFDPGFILSFSAVLSIIYFYPRLEMLISRFKFYNNLDEGDYYQRPIKLSFTYLFATLSALLGILPITAIMFEKISIVSLFTNLVVVPLSNIAMAVGFLVILTSLVSFWLAGVFASAAALILYFLLWFIDYFAGFDFSFIETYSFDTLFFVSYYLILFTLFSMDKSNYRAKLIIIIFIAVDLFLFNTLVRRNENTAITYLDVGNSNACLISVRNDYNFLVGTGSSNNNYNASERTVIPYLKRQRIDKIDLLVVSDLDFNEFRNLVEFVIDFPVSKIILPAYYKPLFEGNLIQRVFKKSELFFADTPFSIKSFRDVRFYVSCRGKLMLTEFIYGNNKFAFSDPAPRWTSEESYGEDINILRTTAAPSFDNYHPQFIMKSDPQVIITSAPSSKKKKVQTQIFEQALNYVGIETINVSNQGAAIFESDGRHIERINWR